MEVRPTTSGTETEAGDMEDAGLTKPIVVGQFFFQKKKKNYILINFRLQPASTRRRRLSRGAALARTRARRRGAPGGPSKPGAARGGYPQKLARGGRRAERPVPQAVQEELVVLVVPGDLGAPAVPAALELVGPEAAATKR